MIKSVLKILMASSISAVVVLSSDADAAGKRRGLVFSASPAAANVGARRIVLYRKKVHVTRRFVGPRVVRPRLVQKRIVGVRILRPRMVRSRIVGPRIVGSRYVAPRLVRPRYVAPRLVAGRYVPPRLGIVGVPAQAADAKPSTEDLMAGICNGAGGGASTHPDGTVHCTDPDGNEVLDPVPAPD